MPDTQNSRVMPVPGFVPYGPGPVGFCGRTNSGRDGAYTKTGWGPDWPASGCRHICDPGWWSVVWLPGHSARLARDCSAERAGPAPAG